MAGWLKIKSAAMYADVSPKTVRAWLKNGLKSSRPGGIILIRREWIDEFLEGFSNTGADIDSTVDNLISSLRETG
jgi:excisionase family DNA binding protein